MITLTQKLTSLYIAYTPDLEAAAYGGCRDEALNNLTEQIRYTQDATSYERKKGNA